MKQVDMGLNLTTKRMRKREFLVELERLVRWAVPAVFTAPVPLKVARIHESLVRPLGAGHGRLRAA
jgi:hypothetical protein